MGGFTWGYYKSTDQASYSNSENYIPNSRMYQIRSIWVNITSKDHLNSISQGWVSWTIANCTYYTRCQGFSHASEQSVRQSHFSRSQHDGRLVIDAWIFNYGVLYNGFWFFSYTTSNYCWWLYWSYSCEKRRLIFFYHLPLLKKKVKIIIIRFLIQSASKHCS